MYVPPVSSESVSDEILSPSHFGEGQREAKVISFRNNKNSSKHVF